MAAVLRAATPVLISVVICILLVAVVLVAGGVLFVYLGATGNTELTLFGNTFRSDVAGAIGIFVGAVVAGIGIRQALQSVERLGTHPYNEARPGNPPKEPVA